MKENDRLNRENAALFALSASGPPPPAASSAGPARPGPSQPVAAVEVRAGRAAGRCRVCARGEPCVCGGGGVGFRVTLGCCSSEI